MWSGRIKDSYRYSFVSTNVMWLMKTFRNCGFFHIGKLRIFLTFSYDLYLRKLLIVWEFNLSLPSILISHQYILRIYLEISATFTNILESFCNLHIVFMQVYVYKKTTFLPFLFKLQQYFKPVFFFRADVTDRAAVFKLAERVTMEVGDVTILMNNAGIMPCKPLLRWSEKEIRSTMDINVNGNLWVRSQNTKNNPVWTCKSNRCKAVNPTSYIGQPSAVV